LRLRIERQGFALVIEDNGQGFATTAASGNDARIASGNGLLNLDQRLQAIGGRCSVRSAPAHGTRVEMVVGLNNA